MVHINGQIRDALNQVVENYGNAYQFSQKVGILNSTLTRWLDGTTTKMNDDAFVKIYPYIREFLPQSSQQFFENNTNIFQNITGGKLYGPMVGKAGKVIHHATSAQELAETKRKVFEDILDAVMVSDRLNDEAKIIMYDIIKQLKQKQEE